MCTGPRGFIPAEDTARVELIYLLDGQRLENVFYIQGISAWTAENLLDLATNAANRWAADMANLLSDQLSLVMVRATSLNSESDFGVEYEPDPIPTGEVTGGSMPNNVTLTTKFVSGLTGRSRRGRVYTPGIPRSSVGTSAVNEVTPVLAGDFSSSWANFFTNLIGLTDNAVAHVVASFCGDKEWRTTALLTPILSYTTNVTLDSQRRRLPERGN